MFARVNRRATAGFMAIALLLSTIVLPVQPAYATNEHTLSGNFTRHCDVNWQAQSQLSHSLTQDYNGDGVIESS